MQKARRSQLLLETLEHREVPATVAYNGSLFISNPHAALIVNQNPATGYWTVMDGASSNGTYNVTGGISITVSNVAANVTVQFASGRTLPGNLTITGGNGNDTLSVQGATGAYLGGNLSIDGGYGNDSIGVGSITGVTVRGNTELTGNLGTNTLALGDAATPTDTSQFRGTLKIHSMENITVSGGSTVLGATTIDMLQAPNTTTTVFAQLNVTFNSGAVLQAVTVNGISAPTTLQFNNGATGAIGTTILNLGNSNNQLKLDTVVNGNLTYNSGANGSTTVTLGSNLNVKSTPTAAGNLTLNVGQGSDSYVFSNPFKVAGNFTLFAPKDNSSDQAITFEGQAGGVLAVTIGNSNDSFTFDGLTGTASAGSASFSFGTGNDLLNFQFNTPTIVLNAVFGTGNDTLSIKGNTTNFVTGKATSGNPPQHYSATNVNDTGFNHSGF